MSLDNETKTDTIRSLHSAVTFTNIPHRFINKNIRVRVECKDHLPVDTLILLSRRVSINIYRDASVYGNIHFRLWNPDTGETSANTEIVVDGHKEQSSDSGFVNLTIPLAEQKTAYPLSASIHLLDEVVNLPCGPDDVIIFK